TRAYKQLCAPPQHTVPQIVAKQWKQFWRWPMEHGARNLWYRTIHNSLPTAERLFRLGLQDLTSATCRLCNDAIDTPAHFLVLCRHRHSVWNLIWGQHYYTEPHTDRLIHFLQTLSWPDHHPPPTHHSHYAPTLIACTMGGIWSAYWQFIFHDTPYTIASVKRNINKALT
ncbi:hypothetical protein BDB00DRAFT_745906, partial [Zychaea mexicana]|uniref:uncharacterized protein n=1 Tax=Zychaea mexicana TaxID=64656 RepID=UPI0022FE0D1E